MFAGIKMNKHYLSNRKKTVWKFLLNMFMPGITLIRCLHPIFLIGAVRKWPIRIILESLFMLPAPTGIYTLEVNLCSDKNFGMN